MWGHRGGQAGCSYRTEQSASKGHVNWHLRVVFKSRPGASSAPRLANTLSGSYTHKFPVQTQVEKKTPQEWESEQDTQRERDPVRFPQFSSHAPATSVHSGVQMLLFAFFLCSGWGGYQRGPSQEEEKDGTEMETEWKQREYKIFWKSGEPLVPLHGPHSLCPISDVSQSSSLPPPPPGLASEPHGVFLPRRASLSTCERFSQIRYESGRWRKVRQSALSPGVCERTQRPDCPDKLRLENEPDFQTDGCWRAKPDQPH